MFPQASIERVFSMFDIEETGGNAQNTRTYRVAPAATVIGPDVCVLLASTGPDTVVAAAAGTPVIGTDTVIGRTVTYSNNTTTEDGNVEVQKADEGVTYRVKLATPVTTTAAALALIGGQYVFGANQTLDIAATAPTNGLKVVSVDISTQTAEVELVN